MRNSFVLGAAVVGALTISIGSGCSDEPTTGVDGGAGASRSFVVRSMDIPTTTAEATALGYDIDGDSRVDNALGAILAAIKAAAPGMEMEREMNQYITDGRALTLMKVTAKNFTTDAAVTLEGWTGDKTVCCATRPCPGAEADTKCYGGDHTFKTDVSSPKSTMSGKITAGKLVFGPGTTSVLLPLGDNPVQVTLVGARVEGTITSTGIVSGRIMGAITSAEAMSKVVPAAANQLTREMNDPQTSAANKASIQQYFDTDKNGTITSDELKANGAIKLMLAGDVDADKDGKKEELSAGVGFTAVGCKIQTQ